MWFALGTTDRGPAGTPVLIQSLTQFITSFGQRQSYSVLYDAIETFFREGGAECYISRVVGPNATTGFKNLNDAGALVSLIANAIGPGAWSSGYMVGVVAGVAGGSYQIQVTDTSNNVLEQSGDLLDQPSAVTWSNYSNYIRISIGPSANLPVNVAPAALSAGNDDRANITDTQWQNALNAIGEQYGPGQVSMPGRYSTVAYNQLTGHAQTNNRVALLDLPNSGTVATLQGAAAGINSRFAAAFCPWVVIPGVTTGTTRTVPPCAFIAGLLARNDPTLGPDTPAAGNNGQAMYVVDLSQPDWSDSQRTSLNTQSCNVIRRMFGGIRNYGWRSLTNATTDPGWVDFGNARLYMDLSAELDAVGEQYVFMPIDGQNGATISAFHGSLAAVLLNHYNKGDLFGDSADQAFSVDTGPSVNTLATIANNELHAVCQVKMSPMAEWVQILIAKLQVTQTIGPGG
jgi:hypothetical protein